VTGQLSQTEPPTKQTEPPIRLREEMLVRPTPSKPKFQSAAPAPIEQPEEKSRPAPREEAPVRPHQPARRLEAGSAIGKAVEEVQRIVASLEDALEQMEEVLKLVETADRQKIGDEQEIDSLRRQLRRIQSPRSGQEERHGH
jgi:hypothetical protein